MGTVTLKYNGSQEHLWEEGDQLNEASSSGMLSMTTVESQLINLRQFDSQPEAQDARERLGELILEGLGNGDVVIVIDDL